MGEGKFRNLEWLETDGGNSYERVRDHIGYKKDRKSAAQQTFFLNENILKSNQSPKSGMFNVCVIPIISKKEIE